MNDKIKPKGRAPKHKLHDLLVRTAEGRKTKGPIFTAHALAYALKIYCEKHGVGAENIFNFVMVLKPWEHDSFGEMCEAFNIRHEDGTPVTSKDVGLR